MRNVSLRNTCDTSLCVIKQVWESNLFIDIMFALGDQGYLRHSANIMHFHKLIFFTVPRVYLLPDAFAGWLWYFGIWQYHTLLVILISVERAAFSTTMSESLSFTNHLAREIAMSLFTQKKNPYNIFICAISHYPTHAKVNNHSICHLGCAVHVKLCPVQPGGGGHIQVGIVFVLTPYVYWKMVAYQNVTPDYCTWNDVREFEITTPNPVTCCRNKDHEYLQLEIENCLSKVCSISRYKIKLKYPMNLKTFTSKNQLAPNSFWSSRCLNEWSLAYSGHIHTALSPSLAAVFLSDGLDVDFYKSFA